MVHETAVYLKCLNACIKQNSINFGPREIYFCISIHFLFVLLFILLLLLIFFLNLQKWCLKKRISTTLTI